MKKKTPSVIAGELVGKQGPDATFTPAKPRKLPGEFPENQIIAQEFLKILRHVLPGLRILV